MTGFHIGPLPVAGGFLAMDGSTFTWNDIRGVHADVYPHLAAWFNPARPIGLGTVQQAFSLAYVLRDGGWIGATSGHGPTGADFLMSTLWSFAWVAPAVRHVLDYRGTRLAWVRPSADPGAGVELELDGRPVRFRAADVRQALRERSGPDIRASLGRLSAAVEANKNSRL